MVLAIFPLRRRKAATTHKSGDLERRNRPSSAGNQAPKLLKDDVIKFEVSELLSHDALGSTYKAGDRLMVVKRFKHMKGASREEFCNHILRLGRLTHPNVLPIVAFYYKDCPPPLTHVPF